MIQLVANPALTGFQAPKILWLRNHEPRRFDRLQKVLLAKDEIRRRLIGDYVTELESLVDDLHHFDIGLMPLSDDGWSRAKCGGKLLQYMACGIPPVVSPVGINAEIIRDGVNGFLANGREEWIEKTSLLCRDSDLRRKMGLEARATIERGFSNLVVAPLLERALRRVAAAGARHGGGA